MKSILIFTLMALMGLALPATSFGENLKEEFVCYSSNNYRGQKKMFRSGEYTNTSQWRYNSWKTNCAVKLYYHTKNGRKAERTLKGDVRDLRSQMRGWKDLKYGYRAGWRNIYKAVFFCADDRGQGPKKPPRNTGSNDQNYNKLLNSGHCVVWKGSGYGQDYVSYKPGQKYFTRNLKFRFASMRLPNDYLVMFTYRSKSGRSKTYECKTDVRDMKYIANTWDVRDKRNPWSAIQYFEIKKKGNTNTGGGANKAYLSKEWYNRYKTGYIVFSEHKYYDGDYEAKPNGDYDYRKLGFHPLSIYVPKANRYVIMEYKAKNGKIKSAVIKKSIDDLDRYLYHLGVYKDYKKTPYKAVKRFAVIRQ